MSNQVIIGASNGIGAAIAAKFLDRGDHVWGTYNQTYLEAGERFSVQRYDVIKDAVPVDFFPDRIDGLVYCPGTIDLKPFNRFSREDLLLDYQTNVLAAFDLIKTLLPNFKRSGSAAVTLFSSVAVQKGFPFHLQVALSKGAIEGMVRALSAELAPTVRLNAIAPSLTRTHLSERLLSTEDKIRSNAERHPLKRIGSPEDHAGMVSLLHSTEGSWITGQIIHVDGGLSISH
jgi:NAD(P)-dependent dehydrogenase (short-subunit alcohol dehydrogenase family)